ncbi:MAG TPA: hypothetical protein PLL72_09345 [Burkholderiaceae bacterium]|nr:hypothetical protein [Burkholderiaceae bacterium]
MANDVFRASDAVLVLAVDDKTTPEGAAADALVTQYGLANSVARLSGVTIAVASDVQPFYEIGRRYPTHLRGGSVRTSGTVQRAHVNGALIRLLLGDGATSPPGSANFVQPSFNIIATLQDSAHPDSNVKVIVFGVKFTSWQAQIPQEDFVMEQASFEALRVAYEEA